MSGNLGFKFVPTQNNQVHFLKYIGDTVALILQVLKSVKKKAPGSSKLHKLVQLSTF